jgi:hypothetical protein
VVCDPIAGCGLLVGLADVNVLGIEDTVLLRGCTSSCGTRRGVARIAVRGVVGGSGGGPTHQQLETHPLDAAAHGGAHQHELGRSIVVTSVPLLCDPSSVTGAAAQAATTNAMTARAHI